MTPAMSASYRKGRLVQALFKVLHEQPDGVAAKDAIAAVKARVELAPEEQGVFEETGQEKFPKLIRFATIGPVKAGWMLKQDGTWTVTEAGMDALKQYPDPEQFYKQSRAL
jgi:restriction system protein